MPSRAESPSCAAAAVASASTSHIAASHPRPVASAASAVTVARAKWGSSAASCAGQEGLWGFRI